MVSSSTSMIPLLQNYATSFIAFSDPWLDLMVWFVIATPMLAVDRFVKCSCKSDNHKPKWSKVNIF